MDLEGLNQWLAERNLKGHWDHQPWSQTVRTHLWKGKDIFEGLNQAGELITTGEAARLLGVSRQHVVDLCDRGLLACERTPVHRRVRRTDVDVLRRRGELTREEMRSLAEELSHGSTGRCSA